jgi:hypothetical protein
MASRSPHSEQASSTADARHCSCKDTTIVFAQKLVEILAFHGVTFSNRAYHKAYVLSLRVALSRIIRAHQESRGIPEHDRRFLALSARIDQARVKAPAVAYVEILELTYMHFHLYNIHVLRTSNIS